MSEKQKSRLRFNLGFLLEGDLGASRVFELSYPSVRVGPDVVLSPLQGKFRATHTSKGLYLQGQFETKTETVCTRCLLPIQLAIFLELDDLFYHPPSSAPDGEFSIGENGILDIAPLLRELSLLAVPMQVVCREDCQGICEVCGQNLNELRCTCAEANVDPRLEVLRKLLDAEP